MYKKIIRTNLIFTTLFVCLSIGLIAVQVDASWLTSYFESNPTSIEDLKSKWGEPANVVKMENGVEKLIFGPKDAEIGYTCFFVKDNRVIDRGITDSLEKPQVVAQSKGPELKSYMASYYKTHPMSVETLKAKYGEPLSNHDYDNGIKKLTFGPKDAEVGYTYFLIKDGVVVDQNVTGN